MSSHVLPLPGLDLLDWKPKGLPDRQDLEAYSFVVAANPVIALLPANGELLNGETQRL